MVQYHTDNTNIRKHVYQVASKVGCQCTNHVEMLNHLTELSTRIGSKVSLNSESKYIGDETFDQTGEAQNNQQAQQLLKDWMAPATMNPKDAEETKEQEQESIIWQLQQLQEMANMQHFENNLKNAVITASNMENKDTISLTMKDLEDINIVKQHRENVAYTLHSMVHQESKQVNKYVFNRTFNESKIKALKTKMLELLNKEEKENDNNDKNKGENDNKEETDPMKPCNKLY